MRVGVFQLLADSRADPAVVAARAEELGFESYWVGDHPVIPVRMSVPYPAVPDEDPPAYLWQIADPLMALARASATTRTLQLGTAVCLASLRHPVLTALQIATLDDLAGGRFILGVGGGWNPDEARVMGGDFEHRWGQVADHVAAMRELWAGEISEYHGRYADFEPLRCFPKPARMPPVLLGSTGTATSYKRVVRWGDGWMPANLESVEHFGAGVREISALAIAAGRDPATMDFTVSGLPGEWRTRDERDALGRAGAGRLIVWLEAVELDGILAELEVLAAELLPA